MQGKHESSSRWLRAFSHVPLVALLALVTLAAFAQTPRLWGVHCLGYYPVTVRWLVLALVALVFVPSVSRRVYDGLLKLASLLTARSAWSLFLCVVVSLAAFVAFLRVRAATLLLGDGQLYAGLWRQTAQIPDLGMAGFVGAIWSDYHNRLALGTNINSFLLGKLTLATGRSDPLEGVLLYFALLGALLVLTMLLFLRRSKAPLEFRVVVVATVFLSGAMLLFFGYVETYAPMVLVAVLYLLAARHTLRTRRHVTFPILAFLLALIFNCQALLFGPSLVVLVAAAFASHDRVALPRRWGGTVVILTLAAVAAARLAPDTSSFFLPFTTGTRAYGVFSPTHLLDVLNELLLLFPMGVLLLSVAVASLVTRMQGSAGDGTSASISGVDRESPSVSEMRSDEPSVDVSREWRRAFDLALLVPCALFLLVFHPDLGMAHDWDLYVLSAIGVIVAGFSMLRSWLATSACRTLLPLIVPPAVVMSAAIVIPWVGVNADETRSVERYNDIVATDKMSGSYAFEILALHLRDRGEWGHAAESWKWAYARTPRPRYLLARGLDLATAGNAIGAKRAFELCIDEHPDYEDVHRAYIDFLFKQGEAEELVSVTRRAAQLFPDEPYYPFCTGAAFVALGRVEEALEAFETCKRLSPAEDLLGAMEQIMRRFETPE